jgi:voltage-gated potassium channel
MRRAIQKNRLRPWQLTLHEIIFEADTPKGKFFDVLLIASIFLSVLAVMIDTVRSMNERYGGLLSGVEWFFTILFTIEYALRLLCVGRPTRYAVSFFGVVDLLAIAPTYLGLLFTGGHTLIVIRVLRVLRVFRVLKLAEYLGEAQVLKQALLASRRKITVFLITVLTLVVILGALMYMIEGESNGFTSIPRSIYWAVVTLTTVGYGDISPRTAIGQTLAAVVMILGYSIIAIQTGIFTVEFAQAARKKEVSTQACPECSGEGHDPDAKFCKFCGEKL